MNEAAGKAVVGCVGKQGLRDTAGMKGMSVGARATRERTDHANMVKSS